jgi:lipase maturation factor 1
MLSPVPPVLPTYIVTRRLFLRLLGAVYFVAFASLAMQISGLAGERGILPAGRFLEWAHSIYGAASYFQLPTIFWLDASDGALRLAAWGGSLLAILLVLGIAPLLMLVLLWAIYLSLAVAGQDFMAFQWDALLLETGLLAMLWAPATWRLGRGERQPPEPARFLLVFLLLKLMFLSGATKLLSGDPTARHLTALSFHFETQPLPRVSAPSPRSLYCSSASRSPGTTASSTRSRSSSASLSSTTPRWRACGWAEVAVSRRWSHALGAQSCASPSLCSWR